MIKLILSNVLVRKLIKFGIVGGTSFLVSYLFFLGCCQYHFHFVDNDMNYVALMVYATLGDAVGLFVGFRLNKQWTFRHQAKSEQRYFGRYLLVYLVTFFINKGILLLVVEYLRIIPDDIRLYSAPIIATAISAMLNFIGTNHIVFKLADEDEGSGLSDGNDVIDVD